MIHPPQDAIIIGPVNPTVTAFTSPPHPGIAGTAPPKLGVEAITSDPCAHVASIEPPDPLAHALGLVLAISVAALRR